MTPVQEEAGRLDRLGLAVVPLVPNEKRPKHRDWQKRYFDRDDFEVNDNLGLKLGEPSGGLVVVDLDHPLALELAPQFLPRTNVVLGRPSAPASHWFYSCPGLKTKRCKLPDFGSIVEVLSTGTQVVVGPSVHPSGERYDCFRGEPAQVDAVTLTSAVESLYQAVAERLGAEPAKQPAPPPGKLQTATAVPATSAPAQPVTAPRPWERPVTPATSAQEPENAAQPAMGSAGQIEDGLERRIRRATAYVDSYPPAISGQGGHATTLYLVQNLVHRFGLPDNVVLQLLQSYNQRCQPAWSEKELAHKIQQVHEHPADKAAEWQAEELAEQVAEATAQVCGAESARNLLTEFQRKQASLVTSPAHGAVPNVEPDDAGDYLDCEPPPLDPLFPGRFDRGDKGILNAQSKSFKTFFSIQLGLCGACGKAFLDWQPSKLLKILLVQFELKSKHFHRRVRKVARVMGVTRADLGGRLRILNLRGKRFSFDMLHAEKYDLIILDPLYKVLNHEGADEMSAKDLGRVLGRIDQLAELGPGILILHHTPKGRAGDRQAIDRGAGSGVLARDADGIFGLAPHQDSPDSWFVLECRLRNYPSPPPVTIEWQDGAFVVRPDVPAEVETSLGAGRARQTGPTPDAMAMIARQWVTGPVKVEDMKDRIKTEFGIGRDKADQVVRALERAGFTRSRTKSFPACWEISPPDKPPKQGTLNGM